VRDTGQPNFLQQRSVEAIERAALDLAIAIEAHAPRTEAVRTARRTLAAIVDTVNNAIMGNDAR
jgi:hypothetical protein